MVTGLNSVHKHSESPLHWSGRERETIPDYRGCRSHDLRNLGYRCRGSLKNGQNYIIQLFLQFSGVRRGGKPKPRSSSFMVATSRDWNHVFSRLTQLGECNLYAVEAVGSSPTVRIALE